MALSGAMTVPFDGPETRNSRAYQEYLANSNSYDAYEADSRPSEAMPPPRTERGSRRPPPALKSALKSPKSQRPSAIDDVGDRSRHSTDAARGGESDRQRSALSADRFHSGNVGVYI